jgi:hypothetical protein
MVELDLSVFSGAGGAPQIWFAFHSDDNGDWASGWAVDNPVVQIPDPAANYIDFYVFLDDAFSGATEETFWNYAPLTYGVEYTASVAARYTSGLSEKDYYTFLCHYLIPPRNLVGAAPDNAAILLWDPPLTGGSLTLISEEPRKDFPNVSSEYSPMVRTVEVNGTGVRDPWDVQFSFANADASGEAGAETDGEYFYTAMWNGSGFQQYNLDGTYVGPLSVGGVGSIRDLAYEYNEGYMYGGAATSTVNILDFTGGTQIGTFNAPTDVRAIAYDPDFDGFWANNWSTTITLFDKTGTQLNSFPVGAFGSYYGFAHDEYTDGGPYLWGFSQDGSGNVIVQYEIATGTETGFTVDASGLVVVPGSIAGGLWIHPGVFSSNTVTIGGNIQNDQFFGYELTGWGGPGPTPGEVPENLLGYNIYKDGAYVDYVDHPTMMYVHENLDPGCYDYSVTGVYDLTPYGFPGEEGESMHEGPAVVCITTCTDLPFMETWESGNFEFNGWLPSESNWIVNGQSGSPAPSAEFTWDPISTEYSYGLESYPLCAQDITEGDIWMEFDVKLESYNNTGEEYLAVELWNWDSQSWSQVAMYSNLDGSFTWMHEMIKINAVKGSIFKVRFVASGMNSLDILSWNVDNIYIYRTCAAPTELTAEEYGADYDEILLTWTSPGGGLIDEWIHWDSGTNAGNSIGTGAAVEFDVAARWEPAMLADYEGASVTEVAFFPMEAAADYSIRVWFGAGAANLVVDQSVAAPLIGQWNTVTLDNPVLIDLNQELWVGYYVNAQTGYPAGCDEGPAIDGYGNMMNFGGWQTLLQINPDLDYNWNIQVHLQTLSGDNVSLGNIEQKSYEASGSIAATGNQSAPYVFNANSGVRILTGFNIYRSEDGGDYALLDYKEDDGVHEYVDASGLTAGVTYCYMITSVFQSDVDFCESDYSNEDCAFVTVGVDENSLASFAMYPNPAVDHVMIESSSTLKRVTVYNSLGQLIIDEVTKDNRYELNTASYTTGTYMVRVENEAGVTTEVLTIQR